MSSQGQISKSHDKKFNSHDDKLVVMWESPWPFGIPNLRSNTRKNLERVNLGYRMDLLWISVERVVLAVL